MIIARTSYDELTDKARGSGEVLDSSLEKDQVLIVSIEGANSPSIMKGLCCPKKSSDGAFFLNAKGLEPVSNPSVVQIVINAIAKQPSAGHPVELVEVVDL